MMRLAKLRLGGISPIQFQVDEYDRLVHLNSLVPDIRNFHVNTHQQSASTDISQSHAECGRYLLSVGSDSRINLFDLDLSLSRGPVESVDKSESHEFAISSCCWYAVDNGLFTTGSMDQTVGVWDARRMKCVRRFDMKDRVYAHAMSPIPTAGHSLIACGTSNPTVQLCDLRTKSSVQTLIGHQDTVLALQWSPIGAYQLVSGSKDCTIRVWDIRSSGRRSLATLQRFFSSSSNAAHNGAVIGLQFSDDGRWLVSSGHDTSATSRIHLWDMHGYQSSAAIANAEEGHQPFGPVQNLRQNTVRMAITPTAGVLWPPLLFHPTDSGQLAIFELFGGQPIDVLSMHFSICRAVVWDRFRDCLYSSAADGMLLSWRFAPPQQPSDSGDVVGEHSRKSEAAQWLQD